MARPVVRVYVHRIYQLVFCQQAEVVLPLKGLDMNYSRVWLNVNNLTKFSINQKSFPYRSCDLVLQDLDLPLNPI